MTWRWFFSKLLIMKILTQDIHVCQEKKRCTLKQFLKQQNLTETTWAQKWNDSGHLVCEEHLSTSQMKDSFPKWKIPTFWDKQIIHENMIGPTKKTVQTCLHQPEFQRKNFPNESITVFRTTSFLKTFFSPQLRIYTKL